jgi:hypothetical protein
MTEKHYTVTEHFSANSDSYSVTTNTALWFVKQYPVIHGYNVLEETANPNFMVEDGQILRINSDSSLLQIRYPFLRKLSFSTQQITTYINLKISFSQTLNTLHSRFYL